MELLAQCSRALYNEDLLDVKKRMNQLEQDNCIFVVPQVLYANKGEWSIAVNTFCDEISDYIFKTNKKHEIYGVQPLDVYLDNLSTIYSNALHILMKRSSLRWCQLKTKALIRVIKLGFAGIREVGNAGYGSYPFTNWRIEEYRHFILGLVRYFENEYEKHLHGFEHGWLGQIPYYNCSICHSRINGIFILSGFRNRFNTGKTQRCIPCIKKNIKQYTRFQAIVRGYLARRH